MGGYFRSVSGPAMIDIHDHPSILIFQCLTPWRGRFPRASQSQTLRNNPENSTRFLLRERDCEPGGDGANCVMRVVFVVTRPKKVRLNVESSVRIVGSPFVRRSFRSLV